MTNEITVSFRFSHVNKPRDTDSSIVETEIRFSQAFVIDKNLFKFTLMCVNDETDF